MNDLEFTVGLEDVITISIDQEDDISCYQLNIQLHNNPVPDWLHINSYSNKNMFTYGSLKFYHDSAYVKTLDGKKYLTTTNPILSPESLDELDEFLCVAKGCYIAINITIIYTNLQFVH